MEILYQNNIVICFCSKFSSMMMLRRRFIRGMLGLLLAVLECFLVWAGCGSFKVS